MHSDQRGGPAGKATEIISATYAVPAPTPDFPYQIHLVITQDCITLRIWATLFFCLPGDSTWWGGLQGATIRVDLPFVYPGQVLGTPPAMGYFPEGDADSLSRLVTLPPHGGYTAYLQYDACPREVRLQFDVHPEHPDVPRTLMVPPKDRVTEAYIRTPDLRAALDKAFDYALRSRQPSDVTSTT